jgi:hypothetical protein
MGGNADMRNDELFEEAWKLYPRKIAKKVAKAAYMARINEGISWDDLETATRNYSSYCKKNKLEPKFILHGSTFFGPKERWSDFLVPLVESRERSSWVISPEDCIPVQRTDEELAEIDAECSRLREESLARSRITRVFR